MTKFILAYLLIYGGVHVYAFFKVRHAIDFGAVPAVALSLVLLAMALAPLIVHQAESHGFETTARFLAYTCYIWMAVLFLFFSAAITIDLYRLFIFATGKILHRELYFLVLSPRSAFIIPLGLAILIAFYGYFEAEDIRTERVVVASKKIPRSMKKLTIVQISDVHLGLIVREERLARILDKVKAANPDILVSTGDLVDGQISRIGALAELFKGVAPRFGKFAVTGNHEFYSGLNQALEFTEQAGFKILRGESTTVAGLVTIAGVDDPAQGWVNIPGRLDEKEFLSALPQEKFILLLKHRPALEKRSIGLIDLQLSGHVHKGQIFPFNLVTHFFYPVISGYTTSSQRTSLYVSRGTGTWGPPIRFLAPPEVTVIELVPAGDD